MIPLDIIYKMDCLEGMKLLDDNSVDSIVTDPPYGLEFMGKEWDKFRLHSLQGETNQQRFENIKLPRFPNKDKSTFQDFTYKWAIESLRVLKPGGHLLSFGGTRTYHRMACAIEDAGFEIRDMISWLYGSGFPKSLNVGKAVDKLEGNEREVDITKGNTPFEGQGTALKPACEPIVVARKPISERNIALNCLKWGTGGLDIDGCRIEYKNEADVSSSSSSAFKGFSNSKDNKALFPIGNEFERDINNKGRFPANIILDEEAAKELDKQSGISNSSKVSFNNIGWKHSGNTKEDMTELRYQNEFNDKGGASRFFYVAKASKGERNDGCDNLEPNYASHDGRDKYIENPYQRHDNIQTNFHPTVKPVTLMQYLVKLVTPKDGLVLDPFIGSGTTAIAAWKENKQFIGFEKDAEYHKIALARIKDYLAQNKLTKWFEPEEVEQEMVQSQEEHELEVLA